MTRIQSVLSNSAGRFVSLTVENTKIPRTVVSAKVLSVTPNYVKLFIPAAGESGLVHKNSIRRVRDGRRVANSL